MLILTRRVGESIRIGDAVRLTIRDKWPGQVLVVLSAPASMPVTNDADLPVLPMRVRRRERRYLIAMTTGDHLRIGKDVVVWFGACYGLGAKGIRYDRQVRIGIDAPRSVAVHREEVYWRIRQQAVGDVRTAV